MQASPDCSNPPCGAKSRKIVYKKEVETLLLAKQFEMKIKKMKSRKYIEDLLGKL